LTNCLKQVNVAGNAEVVELVDTLASGASGGNPVEVRVLFSVPYNFRSFYFFTNYPFLFKTIFKNITIINI
jgi:hypothetical protein